MSYYRVIDGKKYDRALLEAFERSITGQGDGRVSGTDVQQEIEKRTADGKGLTQVEIETLRYAADRFAVTGRGQEELSALTDKLHGQPVFSWQNVGGPVQTRLDGQALSRAELDDKAAAFVIANASDGARVDAGKIFPGVDSSNMGMFAYTLDGADGDVLRKLAGAMLGTGGRATIDRYDATKHQLVAVRVTFDEERMYVGLQDNATGEIEMADGYVDYTSLSYDFDDADDFERKVGVKISDLDENVDPQYWDEADQEELAHALTRGGRLLDLGKRDDIFGRPGRAELERLTWDTDRDWGDENIMDGAVEAKAGEIPAGFPPDRAAVRVLEQELRWDDMVWSEAPAAGAPRTVTNAVIKQAAKMVHDGFGYAPQNTSSFDDNLERIEKLVDKLGKRADVDVVVAEGKGNPEHLTTNENLLSRTYLFMNRETGDFVAVTARDSVL